MSNLKFIFVIPDMSWLYDYKAQFALGILYISTILKEEGWEVEIFDSNIKKIEDIPFADAYGFSIVYDTYENSILLAKEIKQMYPNSAILAGGVHPSLNPFVIDKIFDVIFIGEAEDTIREWCRTKENKRYYHSHKIVDIDTIYPDRSILPLDYIKTYSIFSGGRTYSQGGATSIMFSRGCPFNCAFCCSPQLYHRKIHFRSIVSIIREITDIIKTYGIRQFRIQDDTFTSNLIYLRKLCEELKNLDIYYRCSTRVNTVNEEVIKLLYESGCREIGLGIEVADNRVLKKLKKGTTIVQAEKAIQIIKQYPITIRCFFMIGLPFDSFETMQKNIAFIEDNKIDNVVVGNFIPFPGCEMYKEQEKYNIKEVKKETCMNIAKHIELKPNILRMDISEEEHIEIMRVFYNYLLRKDFI